MLEHPLRRWPNIIPALDQRLMFAELYKRRTSSNRRRSKRVHHITQENVVQKVLHGVSIVSTAAGLVVLDIVGG